MVCGPNFMDDLVLQVPERLKECAGKGGAQIMRVACRLRSFWSFPFGAHAPRLLKAAPSLQTQARRKVDAERKGGLKTRPLSAEGIPRIRRQCCL